MWRHALREIYRRFWGIFTNITGKLLIQNSQIFNYPKKILLY
jgi:hypothetical protein